MSTCCGDEAAEAVALRLLLSYDSDDGDSYVLALAEVGNCGQCLVGVINVLVKSYAALLDAEPTDWRPMMLHQLAHALDQLGGQSC